MSDDEKKSCQIKVVVSKNAPTGGGGVWVEGPTADLCTLCGTDHGYVPPYAAAMIRKVETIKRNLREIYGMDFDDAPDE